METKERHKWNNHKRKTAVCLKCGCEYYRGVYTIIYTMPDGKVYQNKAPNCITNDQPNQSH